MTFEALDKLDAAASAYQNALDLFPNAQSANLSMSAVEHKRGDTASAALYAQRAVDTPPAPDAAADPMMVYQSGRGRHVQEAWAAYYVLLEHAR